MDISKFKGVSVKDLFKNEIFPHLKVIRFLVCSEFKEIFKFEGLSVKDLLKYKICPQLEVIHFLKCSKGVNIQFIHKQQLFTGAFETAILNMVC